MFRALEKISLILEVAIRAVRLALLVVQIAAVL